MASAPIDIPVKVKGLSDLDKLVKRMDVLEKEVSQLNGKLPKAVNNISKVGRASGKAARGVNKLSTAFKGLLGGLALAGIAKSVLSLGNSAATSTAELQKLGIALRGVLGDDTKKGFKAIEKAARDFAIPIEAATRNFTQLSAAGITNGNSVEELETLYRGLAAATKATGGNAEDLNGVLRAATQVLSKGKVQAEELRGQIGDRLPGAFQLFAKATNRSAQELEQALADGEVSAEEFVTQFGRFIKDKYEPAARRIGDSPAEAGARLTKALEDLNRSAGPLLASLGAKFQDFANKVVSALIPVSEYLKDFFGFLENSDAGYTKALAKLAQLDASIADANKRFSAATDKTTKDSIQLLINELEGKRQKQLKAINTLVANTPTAPLGGNKATKDDPITEIVKNDPVKQRVKSIQELLGFDWNQALGVQESNALLRITEAQKTALEDGQLALYDQLETSKQYVRPLLEIKALEEAVEKTKARLVEYSNDEIAAAKIKNQLTEFQNQLLERQKKLTADQLSDSNEILKADLAAAAAFAKIVQNAEPLNKELTQTQELLKGSFEIVSGSLTNAMKGLIDGTKEWGDVLSDVLTQLSGLLLNAAFKGLGGSIGIPGFANGGRPTPGQVSVVGEKGPELFIPDRAGTVISNQDSMAMMRGSSSGGGDVTVINNINVEKGTNSTSVSGSGDSMQAVKLAKMVESATMQVINREKRPGGSLATR